MADYRTFNQVSSNKALWRSEGIISNIHLKYATLASLIPCIICITASYFHMHNQLSLFESAISIHHLSATTGVVFNMTALIGYISDNK